MNRENYANRVMGLSSYCALQAKILEVYCPDYDNIAMLKEISPLATKAIRASFFRNRRLKSLEKLSQRLDQRISDFERQRPDITNLDEVRELKKLSKQRKREYKELSGNS
jgi:hypothetical protein|tara:strand:- start:158 stop:487 length:330 start_codon:yes stop_codon:yes gene_type:complete